MHQNREGECIRVFQRKTGQIEYTQKGEREREGGGNYDKALAHTIMEASKCNLQGGLELETQEELMFRFKGHQAERTDVADEAQRQSAG